MAHEILLGVWRAKILVAVACFFPGRAKDLDQHPGNMTVRTVI